MRKLRQQARKKEKTAAREPETMAPKSNRLRQQAREQETTAAREQKTMASREQKTLQQRLLESKRPRLLRCSPTRSVLGTGLASRKNRRGL